MHGPVSLAGCGRATEHRRVRGLRRPARVDTTSRREPRKSRRWRTRNGLTVPTSEAIAEALQAIPDGSPWAWAALRVLPAVRGERIQIIEDVEMDRLGFEPLSTFPSLQLAPGVDVTFAIEADVVYITVSQEHLDAWEMTTEQVLPAAMANLRRAVGTWRGSVYDDEFEGITARMMRGWPMWASSLVLVPDELKRVFGPQDHLLIAPYQCNLISLPVNVDRDVAADIVDLFGIINPKSLLLGMPSFVLRDGELSTEELPGFPDDPEDEPEHEPALTGFAT